MTVLNPTEPSPADPRAAEAKPTSPPRLDSKAHSLRRLEAFVADWIASVGAAIGIAPRRLGRLGRSIGPDADEPVERARPDDPGQEGNEPEPAGLGFYLMMVRHGMGRLRRGVKYRTQHFQMLR